MQPAESGGGGGGEEGTETGLQEELEEKHVHAVYSQIARHFSDTRYKPWPRVAQFLLKLPPGCLVADVGCGNGKYMDTFQEGYTIGCDACPELVAIAASRGHEVTVGSCLSLPFRSGWFDAVICIAVVHHLSSQVRRAAAIRELVRVVRGGGRMLVYVWAMEQERKKFVEQDVMVPWHLQPQYLISRGKGEMEASAGGGGGGERKKRLNKKQRAKRRKCPEGEEGEEEKKEEREEDETRSKGNEKPEDDDDIQIDTPDHVTSKGDHMIQPDRKSQGFQTFLRYYHVFKERELSGLFNEVGGVKILEEFYDHENWCVIAERIVTDQSNH